MKRIIYILLGLVLAAVVAITALITLIDPNQFKPLLAAQVKKSTGRELVIEGDIDWRLWPTLGLSLEQVALRNPAGFAEPDLIRVGQGQASVALLPLLSRRLELDEVTLVGAHLFIQTRADGSSNLGGLIREQGAAQGGESAAPATPTAASESKRWQISLQGMVLEQASALVRDDRNGTLTRLERLDLDLDQLALGQWVPVTLAAKGEQGTLAFDLEGQGEIKLARDALASELKGVSVSGSVSQPQRRLDAFSLKADRLALGEWSNLNLSAQGSQGEGIQQTPSGSGDRTQDEGARQTPSGTQEGIQGEGARQTPPGSLERTQGEGARQTPSGSLEGTQGEGARQTLAGSLEGTLKARLDQSLQLVEISDARLEANLEGESLPRPQMSLKLAGFARAELDQQKITLSKLVMSADELLLSGEGVVRLAAVPRVEFDLKGEQLDLDSWLGKPAAAKNPAPAKAALVKEGSDGDKGAAAPAEVAKALGAVEPDLSALKLIDLAGRLQLGSLRVSGLDLSAVDLQLLLTGGRLTLKQFSAGVAGGQVTANGVLDARQMPATYQLHKRVQGVNVRPLLQILAGSEMLEGKGDLEVAVQGRGLSKQARRSNMQGRIGLALSDGALQGINLAEMIREARAMLKGQGGDRVKEVRKTDFSALTASFQLANGVARSDDIQLFAPTLRVRGQGQTVLVPETLDFLFLTSIVESSKGQGGKGVDELKDITIPVRIGGHWQAPSYRLDGKALLTDNKLLEEKARKEAERGLKKLLGDKADNEGLKGVTDELLKELFK